MYLSITKDDTNEDTGNKHVDPLQVDVDEDHIDIEDLRVHCEIGETFLDSDNDNVAFTYPTQPQQQQQQQQQQWQYLKCDEFWNTVVCLCGLESLFFVLKVILLPVQLYIMIGGPLLVLFIWPLWAVINSAVFMGVFWARDPATAPCLSNSREWWGGHAQPEEEEQQHQQHQQLQQQHQQQEEGEGQQEGKQEPLHDDHPHSYHQELQQQQTFVQGEQLTPPSSSSSPVLESSPPISVSELDMERQQEQEQGEEQEASHSIPPLTDKALYTISRPRMAGILAMWSVFDFLLSLLSALASFVFVFITFTDADGSIAEGWILGYVLMIISGASCVVSMVLRIAMIVYCLRFRYRVAARAAHQAEGTWETALNHDHANASSPSTACANNFITGGDNSQTDDVVIDTANVFAPKQKLSLFANKTRVYLFVWALVCCLVGMIMGSITLHDVLRAQYYLPNAQGNTLHGDLNNERCDPMDPLLCLLPFPSSYYLEPSATTSTGVSVDITDEMLPMLKRGVRYKASFSRLHDGFSVSSMLVWYLSPHVNSEQFISYNDINQSVILSSKSTTLLIHSDTLELHPHFTEKDYLDYEDDKLSYLVPAKSLLYDTTYIVLVKGLTDMHGVLLPPAPLYQEYLHAYRHNVTFPISPSFQASREARRYALYANDIFPKLESMGINLSEVQLLWDFHTASQASIFQNLAPIYNLTTSLIQERLDKKKELYKKISTNSEQCTGTIYSSKTKQIYYTLNVPWYLTDHSRLLNPTKGNKVYISDTDKQHIPFAKSAKLLLQIPCSVSQGLMPASALMEIGHGLFWDRSFAEIDHITEQANQHGWIVWSMDWRGLTRHDLPQFLRLLLHDMSETGNSTLSAMTQGMSDKLAGYLILQLILEAEYTEVLRNSAFFSSPDASTSTSTSSASLPSYALIPPKELRYSHSTIQVPNLYMGISLGAIMGAAWNAYSTIHLRSVLIAGGSLFTFFLSRSDIFGMLKSFTDLQFYSRKDLRLGVQLMQLHLDGFEASGWAHSGRYQRQLQPGQNASVDQIPSILMQTGIGDSTMTDIAGRILAANLNASLLSPSVHPQSILPSITAPVVNPEGTNVLFQVLYKGDAAVLPTTSESEESTNVHKCIIQRQEITSQYSVFYKTNTVVQPMCEQESTESEAACVFEEQISCGAGL